MVLILDGKKLSNEIKDNLRIKIEKYDKKPGLAIILIGNKSDLEIKVHKYDIMNFVMNEYKNYNIYYKEVSIKNNIPNVDDIYSEFLINLYRIYNKKKVIHNNTTIKLKKKIKKKKKCCFV